MQVESRRFTEKLFDELTHVIRQECAEALMPFEEGTEDESGLEAKLAKYIEYADNRLCEQLGDIASVEALIEWREEFEKRLRGFFKEEVRQANDLVSQEKALNLLSTLTVGRPIASSLSKHLQTTSADSSLLDPQPITQAFNTHVHQMLTAYFS